MDIQVTYLRDVLRITKVTNVPGVEPRMIDIRGPDFRSVLRIEINEEEAPSFVVLNKRRIVVQVPDSQQDSVIRTITALSTTFTATESSLVRFEFTNNPRKLEGLQKMMQTFLLYLLRTPGTDAWFPNSGGGIQRLVGGNYGRSNVGSITADFTLSVSRVRSQIVSLQSSNTRLDPDEKLAAANVLSAIYNKQLTGLVARVELVAQSGNRAIASLEL